MTSRKDVLKEIKQDIEANGILPLSFSGRKKAQESHDKARQAYEESRIDLLRYELASYYRVGIFGSARLKKESPEFEFVTELTRALVKSRDVDIVTGGGPGIMEAANYGNRLALADGKAIGVKLKARNLGESIVLPHEQSSNGHLDYERKHPEFSTRLQAFLDKTQAAYNAPGGIGTLFEMLLLAQSQQVGHLEKSYPVIAHTFWRPVVETWNDVMYHTRHSRGQTTLVSESDLNNIHFSDDIPEIVDIISKDYDQWKNTIRGHVRFYK